MAKPGLVIIGAGGHAGEVLAYLEAFSKDIELLGAFDNGMPVGEWRSTKILGTIESIRKVLSDKSRTYHYLTAFGDNATRKRIVEQIEAMKIEKLSAWSFVHPFAWIGTKNDIGAGTLLAPGTLVTTYSKIGKHCILNIKASVSHDAVVGDFVNLNPGCTILGKAQIETGAYIGAGATVLPGKKVGAWAIVGAGAVVTSDVPARTTSVGVPAQVIKRQEHEFEASSN